MSSMNPKYKAEYSHWRERERGRERALERERREIIAG